MPALGAPPSTPAPPPRVASPARLDLGLPAAGDMAMFKAAGEFRAAVDALPTGPFAHRERFAGNDSVAGEHRAFQVADEPESRMPWAARAEGMAQRFRREGLPVAKLWENHAAFISVGLSPRGKPGIWLIQKTH